ncbi:hypothetical protein [Lusitaniella coriacea]
MATISAIAIFLNQSRSLTGSAVAKGRRQRADGRREDNYQFF